MDQADGFLKVRETLTRVGVADSAKRRLYQSCHVLHKRGRYSIMHFKELFALDGRESSLTPEDLSRRDKIVKMLQDWGLVTVIQPGWRDQDVPVRVKVLRYHERGDWDLVPKYSIGRKDR